MKQYDTKNLEVASSGDFDSVEMTINVDDGHMFDVLMSRMYRDPIGSIIREITSNCFDAHLEANVDDAIVITLGDDDGGDFISFKDVGVGLSRERILKVYKELGRSTKQNDSKAIGFYGLGSKSPFAYVEEGFHVDTIFNGIAYSYFVHKGETKPEVQLIISEPTEDRNGTTVKIYFKNSKDKNEFDQKLEEQLRYFDNVYVIGSKYFNNEYRLHIGKHFKFRDDVNKDIGLHLAMGLVTYPIDWDKLGIEKINIPFALKFDIGDLPVTPERESIRYTTIRKDDQDIDTRDVVKAKIELFKQEIQKLIGIEPFFHNNYIDWKESQELSNHINLLDIDVNIPVLIAKQPPHYYQPLYNKGLKTPDVYFFNGFSITRSTIAYEGYSVTKYESTNLDYKAFKEYFLVREFEPINRIKRVKLDYIRSLAKEAGKHNIYFFRPNSIRVNKYLQLPKVVTKVKKDIFEHFDYSSGWNRMKLVKYYKSIVLKEVLMNSIDYQDIEVPEKFIKEWKIRNKDYVDKLEAEEGEIIIDNIKKVTKTDRKTIVTLEYAVTFSGFIIYGYETDLELLELYADLFSTGKFKDYSEVWRIRKKDEKDLVKLKNTIYVQSFMNDTPIFKEIATAAFINKSKLQDYKFYPVEVKNDNLGNNTYNIFSLIFLPVANKWRELLRKSKGTVKLSGIDNNPQTDFIEEILTIAKANGWLENDVVEAVNKVEKYFQGLELLSYIVPDTKSLPLITNFIKLSGKPINQEWIKLENWQIELMKELQEKFNYYNNVAYDSVKTDYLSVKVNSRIQTRRSVYKITMQNSIQALKEVQIFKSYHNV